MCTELYDNDITQTLLDENYAQALSKTGLREKCQFAIDTGMNRIGLDADNPKEWEKIIRTYAEKSISMSYLHISMYCESVEFTDNQIQKFGAFATRVIDINLSYVHCLILVAEYLSRR